MSHRGANNNDRLRKAKLRAAKISKTTPCKVAGPTAGGWRPEKKLDLSGKSLSYFHHSEML
jgi:hypothetical protein